jgi:hypothetical protein
MVIGNQLPCAYNAWLNIAVTQLASRNISILLHIDESLLMFSDQRGMGMPRTVRLSAETHPLSAAPPKFQAQGYNPDRTFSGVSARKQE